MGLRELKAERVRARILDVALDLFMTHGFAGTSMEQIAERAEVGSTTLYRYFPSKDHLALGPFNYSLRLGDALRGRPVSEPLAESLGAVILGALDVHMDDVTRLSAVLHVMDSNPGTRAALWDLLEEGRENLGAALAERMGTEPTSTAVVLASRLAFSIWELAWVRWGTDPSRSIESRGTEVLTELRSLQLVLPTVPTGTPDAADTNPVGD